MQHPDLVLRESKRRLEHEWQEARTRALVARHGARPQGVRHPGVRHQAALALRKLAARLEPEPDVAPLHGTPR